MEVSQGNVDHELMYGGTAGLHRGDQDTCPEGGALHLTSAAPYILCCSGLGCTLNGKMWRFKSWILGGGFSLGNFPFSGGKKKKLQLQHLLSNLSCFLEILGQKFHLKPFPLWVKLRFATSSTATYHFSIFHRLFEAAHLGFRPTGRSRASGQICRDGLKDKM